MLLYILSILLSVQKSFLHPGIHWTHIPLLLLQGGLSKQLLLQFFKQSIQYVPSLQPANRNKMSFVKQNNKKERRFNLM